MEKELIGLTQNEVDDRTQKGLVNKPPKGENAILGVVLTNIFSSYNYLIFGLIVFLLIFYFTTKDLRLLLDSFGIFSLIFVNTSIEIFQELRSRVALKKVSLLLQKTTKVVRDSKTIDIPIEELVIDDLVYIERGDQIVADGNIIKSNRLEIDESLLTGESEPILKNANDELLSGSFVLSGSGYFKVNKFGSDSFAGKITSIARGFKFLPSPLQVKIANIIKILFVVAAVLISLKAFKYSSDIFGVEHIREYTTIIIGLIPQGLIFLSTITYAIGIYRISKIGAIVQKTSAIEAFSGVDIVCTDKTGTLTQNRLSISNVIYFKKYAQENIEKYLGSYAKYSSYKNSTSDTLNIFAHFEENEIEIIEELPFSSEAKISALKIKINGEIKCFILGAYDILEKNIENHDELNIVDTDEIRIYRNLLFAELSINDIDQKIDSIIQRDFKIQPLAVVSISDTVRKDSYEAIQLFHDKNISVKILSGDSAFSVQAVVKEIGWKVDDNDLITGDEIEKLSGNELKTAIYQKKIFARLKPEHKQTIIETLKKDKHFVAMIGDGVNDLPAIKKSNLGIAMQEGSQITQDVSDIILVANKFSLLPKIFDEGNKIVNSIREAAKLFITKNTFTILLTLMTVFSSLPFTLTPRKISFLNIFAITLPSFFISLYNDDVKSKKRFLSDIFASVIIPALVLVIFSYFNYFYVEKFFGAVDDSGKNMVVIATMALLVISNFVSIILWSGISKKNKTFLSLLGFFMVLLFIFFVYIDVNNTPLQWLKELYELSYLDPRHWLLILPVAMTGGIIIFISHFAKELVLKNRQ